MQCRGTWLWSWSEYHITSQRCSHWSKSTLQIEISILYPRPTNQIFTISHPSISLGKHGYCLVSISVSKKFHGFENIRRSFLEQFYCYHLRVSAVKRRIQAPVASLFSSLKSLATQSLPVCHSMHDTHRLKTPWWNTWTSCSVREFIGSFLDKIFEAS